MSKRAIVLLSGGLDSMVASYLYRRQGNISLALTFDYGQRSRKREIEAAKKISDHLGCKHEVLSFSFPKGSCVGSLVNTKEQLPHLDPDKLEDEKICTHSARAVWVPNRNGLMIHWAALVAESLDISEIVVGFNREEAATFPDNSEAFLKSINQSLTYSTLNQVQVLAPTLSYTKSEIVNLGRKLKLPFQHLWSCYEGGEQPCGICESCLRFKRAMKA